MMRKAGLLILVSWLSITVWAGDKIQPLDVKLGLWEMNTTTTSSAQIPFPPEMLAKLSAEQRARLEEQMKAQGGEKTRTITQKHCLTKEKLEEGAFGEDRPSCTKTVLSSTSSKMDVQIECADQGVKTHAKIKMEALNSENVKGTMHFAAQGAQQGAESDATFKAKWLSAACGDIR